MPLHNSHTSAQAGCGEAAFLPPCGDAVGKLCGEAAFLLPVFKDFVILKKVEKQRGCARLY